MLVNDFNDNDNENLKYKENDINEKVYSYSEAIEIAGNGRYTYGLLATLSLTILAMSMDMFGFSTVVSLSSCEFQLSLTQTRVLLAMPYAGAVIMSYGWGYISDTQGRRKSLLIAMSGSFVMSVLCAFSPNWIVLAILKFVGSCFACCANSVSFAFLGESCPDKWKGSYMIAMSVVLNQSMAVYFTLGYFIMQLDFSFDLGFVSFLPWRLLTLVLALPLGFSIVALSCYYESPKYVLNDGNEKAALKILGLIYKTNGGVQEHYPVKLLKLTEVGNERSNSSSFLKSLKEQTFPLFKPPLLKHSALLFSLMLLNYTTINSTFSWLPFIASAFTASVSSGVQNNVFCEMIEQGTNTTTGDVGCEKIELPIAIFCLISSTGLTIITVLVSKLASRRRTVLVALHLMSTSFCLCTLHVRNSIVNLFAFFGIWLDSMTLGFLLSYCVDLFPTSYRGMATCIGVMMCRIGSLIAADLIGPLYITNCSEVFYGIAGLFICNALMSLLLPPDKPKKLK